MAERRDEEDEDGPKIRVVDRRMLNEDERAGRLSAGGSTDTPAKPSTDAAVAPKEEPGSGEANRRAGAAAEPEAALQPYETDDDEPMSPAEMEQMREQVEQEQFAAIEGQMGRPLTEAEKERVRQEMDTQARSVAALEVGPILQKTLADLSAYAAIHMGLMPNPYTRLIAKNDAEARMAIDAFGALYEVMKPRLEAAAQREYARVLNDLRVNYAAQTGSPLAGVAGGSPFGGGGSRIIH